jgi:hypothetical protein
LMVSRVPAWWAFMENQVGFSGYFQWALMVSSGGL